MGFFGGSRGSKRSEDDTETQTSELMNDNYDQEQGLDEEAQEVMAENLDLMRDIVMRIREDPDFASTIYQDCPRLQHLLDDRPDLRPIFEDPYLVQINFEQVYRAAGGKLPEDEEKDDRLGVVKKALVKFVNSPFFKFLRALLLIKKIYACATGNSVASIRNMLTRCGCEQIPCCAPDAPDVSDAANQLDDPNAEEYVGNPENEALRASLYAAADHMEDPEVAEQMNDLLDNDPDGLQEAIENDPDLRALRDSSPLCAELMSDPETMRILVEPDNLRALGDCPDLIEQDFADPNWMPPDVETGGFEAASHGAAIHTAGVEHLDTGAVDTTNADMTSDAPVDIPDTDGDGLTDDVDADADGDGIDNAEDEDADGDGVLDEEEEAPPEYELGDKEDGGANQNAKAAGNKSKQQQNQQGGGGGFFSQVTAGLTDMIAGEIVGTSYGDIVGGGDDLGGLDSAADQAADSADQASSAADNVATAASVVPADDLAQMGDQIDAVGTQMDQLESGMDKIEEAVEDADAPDANAQTVDQPTAGQIAGATAENVIIFGPCLMPSDKKEGEEGTTAKSLQVDEPEVEVETEEEVAEKKKRFGFIGNFASAVGGAAKETLLGAVLGSDLAEWATEKEEEREAEKEEKGQEKEKKSKDKR